MAINAFVMIPWVADEKNIIKAECMKTLSHDYFIVAKTINGGRFYSEPLEWEDTTEMFRDYFTIVQYFGGALQNSMKFVLMNIISFDKSLFDK